MKVVIIGDGVAGTFTAQNLRNLNKDIEIEIISKESYPYYSRIKLPELISEKVQIEDLIMFKDEWYESNKIDLRLSKTVSKIHPRHKHVFIEGEEKPVEYNSLVIATGSTPSIPPIKNARELVGKGVFTLRNIDDALEIRDYIKDNNAKRAIIIGGGLLGLELARQIKNCDLDTTVVEFFPRLLPKQLDVDCGGMLKDVIEDMGINVILDAATEKIASDGGELLVKIKNKQELKTDLVLIQAGINPTINLAKEAKIDTNRGIKVNEYLETSQSGIFAVGDCIEYKNQSWGIIPACIEQSKIAASSILGSHEQEYYGTVPKNTLKIVGIDLTSIGLFDPSDEDLVGAGWDILKMIDEEGTCYKKIVLKDNKIKGAILFGEKKAVPYISRHIETEVEEPELRRAIDMFKWRCQGCGNIYDEAKKGVKFEDLPEGWKCSNCEAPKESFQRME